MQTSSRLHPTRRSLLLLPIAAGAIFILAKSTRTSFDIRSLEVPEAKTLLDSGAVVVDVRDSEKYGFRHIVGSILLPLVVLRTGVPLTFAYAKTTPILVYCNDGVSHGPESTAILNKAGYVNAVNLTHGIEGWDAAGMPVVRQAG